MMLPRYARRAVGLGLAVLSALPVYRVLYGTVTGVSGPDTLAAADRALEVQLLAAGIVLVLGALLARVLDARLDSIVQRAEAALTRPSSAVFAVGAAALAATLTLAFSLVALDGLPNLVDGMTQLLHARFMAEGALAGPVDELSPFWHIQNSVVTRNGWVSHFPPGYSVLLAAGHVAGAPWLVGPLLAGIMAFFTVLAAEGLLPGRTALARLGGLLAAGSPFIIGLAGAYMNHIAAAAFGSIAVFAAVRAARNGAASWLLLLGASLGAAFSIRPLHAIVMTAVVAVALLRPGTFQHGKLARSLPRAIAISVAGGAPFAGAIALYNARFFGHPRLFGYEFAQGPSVGLGFHRDPWGNYYGPLEAIGFTSADLVSLNLHLLDTPLPAVVLIAAYLAYARALLPGEGVVAAWALLPVLTNAFYWHHGAFMGPRMLNEAAPAWCLLVVVATAGIARAIPSSLDAGGYSLRRSFVGAALLSLLAAALYMGPERLIRYGTFMKTSRLPAPATEDPSLVFVHGSWTSRIAMTLAAHGMRLDSVETGMRQNSTCRMSGFADAYAARRRGADLAALPATDFIPDPSRTVPPVVVSTGYVIRTFPGEVPTPDCMLQLYADRMGILDVSPFLWQGGVPGLEGSRALVVRDMGPEQNKLMLRRYPARRALMYFRPSPDATPILRAYHESVRLLWERPVARGPGDS